MITINLDIDIIKKNVVKYSDNIVTFLSDIVKIRSLDSQENQVALRIKEEMIKLEYDDVFIDPMGNVIGRIGSGKTIVAMDAHMDIVDIGDETKWDLSPFSGLIEDSKVFGRGSTDQKGGLASMVYAAYIMKELNLLEDLTLYIIGTVNEEDCEGMCWSYIINEDRIKPDFVILTEPSELKITRGHKGRMGISITVKGLSSHGSAPERGINAIYKMTHIIQDIEKLNSVLKYDSFLGKATIVVSQIFFKSASSCAVPDECTIIIDRRLTKGESKESVINELQNLKSVKESKATVELIKYEIPTYTGLTYPTESYFPAWNIEEEHPVIKSAVKSYSTLFNEDPIVDKWDFSTNGVSICGIHGIPCVGFGPGSETRAHVSNEYIEISDIIKSTMMYSVIPRIYLREVQNK